MNQTEKEIIAKVLEIMFNLKTRVKGNETAEKEVREIEYLLLLLK